MPIDKARSISGEIVFDCRKYELVGILGRPFTMEVTECAEKIGY